MFFVYAIMLFSLSVLSSAKIVGVNYTRTCTVEDIYPSNAVLGNNTIYLINMTWSEEAGHGIEVFKFDLDKNTTSKLGTIYGIMEVFDFYYHNNTFYFMEYNWTSNEVRIFRTYMNLTLTGSEWTYNLSENEFPSSLYIDELGRPWILVYKSEEARETKLMGEYKNYIIYIYNTTTKKFEAVYNYSSLGIPAVVSMAKIENYTLFLSANGGIYFENGTLFFNASEFSKMNKTDSYMAKLSTHGYYLAVTMMHSVWNEEKGEYKDISEVMIFEVKVLKEEAGMIKHEEILSSSSAAAGVVSVVATAGAIAAVSTTTTTSAGTAVGTGGIEMKGAGVESLGAGKIQGKLLGMLKKLGQKILKALSKILRRRRKGEEEEEFKPPSFLKTTIGLAFLGAVVGVVLLFSVKVQELIRGLSLISATVGEALAIFGATISTLFLILLMRKEIVIKKLTRKLAMFGGAISAYYGIISSLLGIAKIATISGALTSLVILAPVSVITAIVVISGKI